LTARTGSGAACLGEQADKTRPIKAKAMPVKTYRVDGLKNETPQKDEPPMGKEG